MPTTITPHPERPELVFHPKLAAGILLKRYKRFLADVVLDHSGETVTAHCMNTGAMTGCAVPGSRVWLSRQDLPHRKLKWTWELASFGDDRIGINTQLPNALVALAIGRGAVSGLEGYPIIQREVQTGGHDGTRCRIDILARGHVSDPRACWVEVKNVTLDDNGWARFPDAPTTRGLKHLEVLGDLAQRGDRAVAFYLVQRRARAFGLARQIDPAYARGLQRAVRRGVEVMAYRANATPESVCLLNSLEIAITLAQESAVQRNFEEAR